MLKFRKVEKKEDFIPILEWGKREDAYLFTPSFLLGKERTLDENWTNYKNSEKTVFLVEKDLVVIGEVSYDLNFPLIMKKDKKTAWIGIVFPEAKGKGYGKVAMKFLEEKIKELGIERIELGCFEYNTRAYDFYKKLGYKEIGRLDKFTYYDNKWWQDIRMEKEFE